LKMRGINYLISKKDGGLKWTFQINFKVATYFIRSFHLSTLYFNLALPLKKIQLGANLGVKWLNYAKTKSLRTKLNFLKKSLLKSTVIRERMNSKIAIVKPLSLLFYIVIKLKFFKYFFMILKTIF
jgi:hypothetical protein